MPIAGTYRGIDFALSNMSNSNIQKVAVITQYNAKIILTHISVHLSGGILAESRAVCMCLHLLQLGK